MQAFKSFLSEYRADDFILAGPENELHARGQVLEPIVETNQRQALSAVFQGFQHLKTAGVKNPIVVGCIPFDTNSNSFFHFPAEVAFTAPIFSTASGWEEENPLLSSNASTGYKENVSQALAKFSSSELKKVVLARSLDLEFLQPVPIPELWQTLRTSSPTGYSYAFQAEGKTIVGATPEPIVLLSNNTVRSQAFAGTTKKVSAEADRQRIKELLSDPKERLEHQLVVDQVSDALAKFCEEVSVPELPEVVDTPQLWHLASIITGKLTKAVSSLELAYAIHPTPAVAGTPTDLATSFIAEHEPNRGFYSGLVGWMDSNGDGEWVLVLRSAMIEGSSVTLHAGAGVVPGSTPDAEHRETAAKFSTILDALGIRLNL